jgi:tRNA(adenine34) deaminase
MWMRRALALARAAAARGEVPVGAVAVRRGGRVGAAGNRMERDRDATAHAEMLALRQAARAMGDWRLTDVTLYVTLEPCPMCAGACVLSRLGRLVYATPDPARGAVESAYQVLEHPANVHRVSVMRGGMEAESRHLIEEFFRGIR